jgi:hypothetical protein
MAEFIVPKFIEREAKIVGPLTFKQFVYIGTAGAILLFLYFQISFPVFIILAIFLLGIAFILAFLKIGGFPFPTVLKNFFIHSVSPKLYIWGKAPLIKKMPRAKEEIPIKKKLDELPLKIAERSRIKKLITEIETKTFR